MPSRYVKKKANQAAKSEWGKIGTLIRERAIIAKNMKAKAKEEQDDGGYTRAIIHEREPTTLVAETKEPEPPKAPEEDPKEVEIKRLKELLALKEAKKELAKEEPEIILE